MTRGAPWSFLKGPSAYFVGNAINQVFPLLLIPVLTSHLSQYEYGIVALFTATVSFGTLIIGLGANAALPRAYYELGAQRMANYIGSLLLLMLLTFVLATVAITLAAEPLSSWLGIPSGWLMAIPFVAAATYVSQTNLAMWQAEQKPRPYVIFSTCRAASYAALAATLVAYAGYAWEGVLGAQSAVALLAAAASIAILTRRGYLRLRAGRAEVRHMVRFAGPLLPHTLARFVQNWADRFVIVALLDLKAAGLYAVAASLARVVDLAIDSYAKAWTPHVYATLRNPTEQSKRLLVRQSYLYLALIALVAGTCVLAMPYVATLILGDHFLEAARFVPFLVLGSLFDGWFRAFAVYTLNAKRTELTSAATMLGVIIQFAVLPFLIHRFGLNGAGMAFALGSFAMLLAGIWASQRVQPMPWLTAFRRDAGAGVTPGGP